MNISQALADHQRNLQLYAAQGLFSCKALQQPVRFEKVRAMAHAIFEKEDRLAQNRDMARKWEPIFIDILEAKYAEAHSKTDAPPKTIPETTLDLLNFERKFIVEDPRWSLEINAKLFHSKTAFLQAVAEISEGQKKSEDDVKAVALRIKKFGNLMRCGSEKVIGKLPTNNILPYGILGCSMIA